MVGEALWIDSEESTTDRLYPFTIRNDNDLALDLGSDPIQVWEFEGESFTVLEQPEGQLDAHSDVTFVLSAPSGATEVSSQIGFSWGTGKQDRFYFDLVVEVGEVEPFTYDVAEIENHLVTVGTGKIATGPVAENLFVAAGEEGVIAVSMDDGVTWTTSWPGQDREDFTRPDSSAHHWQEVVFMEARILIFGRESESSGSKAVAWESRDGFHWDAVELKNVNNVLPIHGVTLKNGDEVFISSRSSLTSPANQSTITMGEDFPDTGSGAYMTQLASDGHSVIATQQNDHLLHTTNGVHWTRMGAGAENNQLFDITYAEDRFVAVGSDHRAILSTDGGATWQDSEKERDGLSQFTGKCTRPDTWCQVRWDGVQFVVYERGDNRTSGGPLLWTSPDAVSWTGEDVVVNRVYEEGIEVLDADNFMEFEASTESGVVIALEDANKTIRDGATPPLYRSSDGITFHQINVALEGKPRLRTLGMGPVPTE